MKIQHPSKQAITVCGLPPRLARALHHSVCTAGQAQYTGRPDLYALYHGHKLKSFVAFEQDGLMRVLHTGRGHLYVSRHNVGAVLRKRHPFPAHRVVRGA